MMRLARALAGGIFLLATASCGDRAAERQAPAVTGPVAAAPAETPSVATTSMNPLLGKPAVQEAIRLALKTGQNQRWVDAGLSGYAVPSLTTQANGCRTVRYTVDQRPDEPMMTINACDASR
jgi:hypothetical protein